MDPAEPDSNARRALRAQLLATEHWSLLASRSTTQSEILTRIAIFLTLVSAGLVTLGIMGQVTSFDEDLAAVTAGVLAFLVLVGVVTQVRVYMAMTEDYLYVAAMNRLRGAYVDLDAGVAPYLMASAHDDDEGIGRTYFFGRDRTKLQVFGSSGMFIAVVTAVLIALLAGDLLVLAGAPFGLAAAVGIVVLLGVVVLDFLWGYRSYRNAVGAYTPLRPTPPA